MSSKEQKARKKSAKHLRVDKTFPSDETKNPDAINPADSSAVGTSEKMSSHSSGSDVQEAREPVQKRMQDFEGDVTRFLMEKRKQSDKDVKASFRSLKKNLQGILKAQQKSRQELKSVYCRRFGSLYEKWLDEVDSTRDQEEHLSFIAQQQMKILQMAMADHETKLENAKDMCGTFLKKANDLSKHRKTLFIGGRQTNVEKGISKVQDRVITETQEQDVSIVETYLQSLILDCSEETI